MLLKRKRSESELSMTSTVSSAFSSPPRPDSSIFSFSSPSPFTQPSLFSSSSCRAPAHLHSRTLKRFRDNRPSEAEVHQHTLDLLYSGAAAPQQHHHQPATPEASDMAPPAPTPATRTQRSLHSFWNIPGSAPAPPSSSIAASSSSQAMRQASPTSCEDCGVALGSGSAAAAYADDGAMDVDGEGSSARAAEGRSCSACGKAVCFSCSVSNLGEQARCLACAGRKVWVGGTGWTVASGVC